MAETSLKVPESLMEGSITVLGKAFAEQDLAICAAVVRRGTMLDVFPVPLMELRYNKGKFEGLLRKGSEVKLRVSVPVNIGRAQYFHEKKIAVVRDARGEPPDPAAGLPDT